MKTNKKLLIGIGALLLIGLGVWAGVDHWQYAQLVDRPRDVKKWEADPRPLQTTQAARQKIAAISQSTTQDQKLVKKAGLVVIPGLRGAWSIDHKTGKAAFGNDWVPQGVTQSQDKIFVSMYDGDHHLNSLVLVVDKKTGHYEKSLILESKAHVGGITYDVGHKRLLWSDDNSRFGGAGISYAAQKTIDAYSAAKMQRPLTSGRVSLHLATRTSALTIYDNQLVIAKYGDSVKNRSIIALPLDANGLPPEVTKADLDQWIAGIVDQLEGKSESQVAKLVMEMLIDRKILNSYNVGWDRLQGIAIAKSGLTLLSQSNGEAPGKIWVRVPEDKSWTRLDFTTPKAGARIINVPNSVEEISLDPNKDVLSMIFESGAKKYRQAGFFMHRASYMDRILVLPIHVQKDAIN